MPPIRTIQVNLNTSEGIIHFKEWFKNTFPLGTMLYFSLSRIEHFTDNQIILELEEKFKRVFNNSNYKTISEIRKDIFISKFKIEVTLHTANLIVDYWKYFFSIAFFEPINDLTFEEFVEYESLHSTFDNKYGKKWLWRKLADKVYIKSFDGDELLISSYTFNVK